jgi:methyl-accepting chemotaxis protein
MKKILLLSITAISALACFMHINILLYIIAGLAITTVLLEMLENKNLDQDKPAAQVDDQKNHLEMVQAQEERQKFEQEYSNKNDMLTALQMETEKLLQGIAYLERTFPVVKQLTEIVQYKSERTTHSLTDSIFSISEESKSVGHKIRDFLNEMFEGDKSLNSDILKLQRETDKLNTLTGIMGKLNEENAGIINVLREMTQEIHLHTEEISDLADQTNVLAINASIVSARAGSHGAGFAVIAGEIQKLAAKSKGIAENIGKLVRNMSSSVKQAALLQQEKLEKSSEDLRNSQASILNVTESLSPQADKIRQSIMESEKLSEEVSHDLYEITVSMQYQDYIKQVLDHIVAILKELMTPLSELKVNMKNSGLQCTDIPIEDVKTLVGKYFTIQEEWNIFPDNQIKIPEQETETKGNITLF